MSVPHWIDEMFPPATPADRLPRLAPVPNIEIDEAALQLAILRELSRQGIEFAEISLGWHTAGEHITHIHPLREDQLMLEHRESQRVNNQIQKWDYIVRKG